MRYTEPWWQLQDAKQRFSELLRKAHKEGPQVVTRRGEEIAVVVDIGEYRRLRGEEPDFKEFLLSVPDLDALDLERDMDLPRDVELGG
jgi:prevent-host-death family protein